MTTIREMQTQVHDLARDKGWWDNDAKDATSIAAKLALVHSEVSEALECVRNGEMRTTVRGDGKPEGFPSELADVVIRCLDLAGALNIDLEFEIVRKHTHNIRRAYRHGGKAL